MTASKITKMREVLMERSTSCHVSHEISVDSINVVFQVISVSSPVDPSIYSFKTQVSRVTSQESTLPNEMDWVEKGQRANSEHNGDSWAIRDDALKCQSCIMSVGSIKWNWNFTKVRGSEIYLVMWAVNPTNSWAWNNAKKTVKTWRNHPMM